MRPVSRFNSPRKLRRGKIFPVAGVALCCLLLSLMAAFVNNFVLLKKLEDDFTAMASDNKRLQMKKRTIINNNKPKIKIKLPLVSPPPPAGTCGQIYFWGGGKSGSTTLFFTLARGPGYNTDGTYNTGPMGELPMIGKEPCKDSGKSWERWERATKNSTICKIQQQQDHDDHALTLMQQTHILNGCPRNTQRMAAKAIMKLDGSNYTKFLMLIRDPVDRIVSQLNDQIRRFGASFNLEQRAKQLVKTGGRVRGLEGALSYQGLALQTLLSSVTDPSQILVIPMESMTVDMQGVIDSVMDHVGGVRWKVNATADTRMNNGKANGNAKKYVTLTNETRDVFREKFRDDVILLERLVSKRFSWSSWAYGGGKDNVGGDSGGDIDWLTTIPHMKRDS